MASITSDLAAWGSQGSVPPGGYNYLEGESPVDEWDNHVTYHLIDELHELQSLANDRVETDKGAASSEPGTPESSHLYYDEDNERLEHWNAATASWDGLMKVGGDTMSGVLDMGGYQIQDSTDDDLTLQATDFSFVRDGVREWRFNIDSGGDITFSDVSSATDFLKFTRNSGPVEVLNANLALTTGQSLVDSGGTERLSILGDNTVLRDNEGTARIELDNDERFDLNVYGNEPLRVFDKVGTNIGVQYDAGSTQGRLRTPEAGFVVEGDHIDSFSFNDGFHIRHQTGGSSLHARNGSGGHRKLSLNGAGITFSSKDGSPIDLGSSTNDPANLRFATGQAIEDGGGDNRYELGSNYTRILPPAGNDGGQIQMGSDSVQLHAPNANGGEVKIRDRYGSFNAIYYRTSSSAPGTLELENAVLEMNGHDIDSIKSTGWFNPSWSDTNDRFEAVPSAGEHSLVFRHNDDSAGAINPLLELDHTNSIVKVHNSNLHIDAGKNIIYNDAGGSNQIQWPDQGGGSDPYIICTSSGEINARDDSGNVTTLT